MLNSGTVLSFDSTLHFSPDAVSFGMSILKVVSRVFPVVLRSHVVAELVCVCQVWIINAYSGYHGVCQLVVQPIVVGRPDGSRGRTVISIRKSRREGIGHFCGMQKHELC